MATLHFRDRAVAAPLKQLAVLPKSAFVRDFRDRAVAAPLKLLRVGADKLRVAHFRDRAVAAPLKLGKFEDFRIGVVISATARSRPH